MTDDATKMKQERDLALAECERLRADLVEFAALVKQNERVLRLPSNSELIKQAA